MSGVAAGLGANDNARSARCATVHEAMTEIGLLSPRRSA